MAVTEGDRAQLVSRLRGVIGDEETETLMAHLPHGGVEELATKEFVRSEVELLRTEMRSGFAELRTEMRALAETMRAEMRALGEQLRGEFRGEIMAAVTSQTRLVFFAMVGTMLSIAALAFTLSRI